MLELIDRQAALKKMCETCGYCEKLEKAVRTAHPDFVSDKCNAYKFLAEQPTIEPEERHGWWIEKERYNLHGDEYCDCLCSECCHRISRPDGFYPDYCEDCGARMDGGDSDA